MSQSANVSKHASSTRDTEEEDDDDDEDAMLGRMARIQTKKK